MKSILVTGDNLYRIAALEYGDPTYWTALAEFNGLNDPFIVAPILLKLPTIDASRAGGIPAAGS